jgi:hypothetical protein
MTRIFNPVGIDLAHRSGPQAHSNVTGIYVRSADDGYWRSGHQSLRLQLHSRSPERVVAHIRCDDSRFGAPAHHSPEEHADGGHVLLEGGGRQAVGLGGSQIVAVPVRAPSLHPPGRRRTSRHSAVGSGRTVVVDGGGKEIFDAVACLAT